MSPTAATAAVIGAGLAGVSTAVALAHRGYPVHLYTDAASHPASAVPLALVRPHLAAQRDPLERVRTHGLRVTQAWLAALATRESTTGVIARGLIMQAAGPRDRRRMVRYPTTGCGPIQLTPEQVHAAVGVGLETPALFHPHGACVDPARFTRALLALAGDWVQVIEECVTAIECQPDDRWRLQGDSGAALGEYGQVVIANGPGAVRLWPALRGRIAPARGQVTAIAATPASAVQRLAISGHGYITPAVAGRHWVGATLQRGDTDLAPRDADDRAHAERFETLWREPATVVDRFVGVRAVTRDRLPIAGRLAPGLWASVGHGAHGLCTAPVCGRLVARGIHGIAHPLMPWTTIDRPALRVPSVN